MFGAQDGKLYKNAELKVNSVDEFNRKMDRAWHILHELIEGQEIIARYATNYSEQVIEKLQAEELEANRERAKGLQAHQEELPLASKPVFTVAPKGGRRAKADS